MNCTECGQDKELRPYGRNGALVCFSCGMKDEETALEQFAMQLEASCSIAGSILIGEETGVRPLMHKNIEGIKCPICGSPEIEANTHRTVYSCGSSDYDQRPDTFEHGADCLEINP